MCLGENIGNAFAVVFETLKSIEELITKCKAELDEEKYYMPADKFLRWSSDLTWTGWIYWSFILLFQRKEDGRIMKNGWINGAVYAVEINVDSDIYKEPKLIIAKIDFGDIRNWSKGCSPSNHYLFYNAIHGVELYEEKSQRKDIVKIAAKEGFQDKAEKTFWGFQKLYRMEHNLVDVTQDNYQKIIFGSIEKLSKVK